MLKSELKNEALGLKPLDKIQLVEVVLDSLEKTNPEIEKKWVEESEKRYKGYKEGKLKGISLKKIKARFE